jgi:hypothetical protein
MYFFAYNWRVVLPLIFITCHAYICVLHFVRVPWQIRRLITWLRDEVRRILTARHTVV